MQNSLYAAMNPNASVAGGVMDAPDHDVRSAAIRAMTGSPLSKYDVSRLSTRMGLEQENAKQAAAHAMMGSVPAGAVGPGGISYSGSMWAPQGSPMAATMKPEAPAVAAARILQGNFRNGAAPSMTPAEAMGSGPGGNSIYNLLQGSRLDPRMRAMQTEDLGMQIDDRRALAADRMQNLYGKQAAAAQGQTNQQALLQAMQPISTPGQTRMRTPAEGAYVMRDPMLTQPAGTREPSIAEAMRSYMGAGGVMNPTTEGVLKAMEAGRPFHPTEEVLGNGTKMILNTPRSAIPDPMQARPARLPGAAKPAGVVDKVIGGKTYHYDTDTKRYFSPDGTEAFTKGGAEPKAPDILLKEQDPELYKAQRETYLAWHKVRQAGTAPTTAAKESATAPAYKSAEEVRAAYQAGALKREDAVKILRETFGHK